MADEYTCTLKPETLQLAIKELNEDHQTRLLKVTAFRERLLKYPGLKPRTDTKFLLRFLRARKFDQEKAFEMYLNYYRMRKEDPVIFTGLKPSSLQKVYQTGRSFPYTHRDRLGRQIYFIFPAKLDTSSFTIEDAFKVEYLNLDKMIEDEENQVHGFTLLIDYKGYTKAQMTMVNQDYGKRMCKLWQDCFPARTKAVILVNQPPFIDLAISVFTPFLKPKMMKRIHRIGTDWKELHELIDPSCLPKCYGGTQPDMSINESWVEKMMKSDEQVEKESKFGFVDDDIGGDTSRCQDQRGASTRS